LATSKPRTVKGRAVLCARLAQEKLAHDILVLDLGDIEAAPAEYFVIASVDSDAQLRAAADSIEDAMRSLGLGSPRSEGRGTSTWVILDYFDIVVHLMLTTTREFYKLERLWGDAKAYTLTEAGTAKATKISTKRTTE
jgi:ribosome-associated protein